MTDRSRTVVLLIDWDNLQICHSRDAPGTELDLNAVTALAQSYGTLVSARAYAEWNLPAERLAVYKAGIEPVFAPVMRPESGNREGKSLADTVMVADGVDLMWSVAPDVFVLVTSDKDMIPLARLAKQRGAAVVILGSDLTAIPLVEMSNVFITYRQLLRELDKTTELDAPSGRAPARERRPTRTARQAIAGPIRPEASAAPAPTPALPPAVSAPAAASATSVAAPAPMIAGDGLEVTGPATAEGIARRRRRRGGRSRGRGSSAASSAETPEAQAEGATPGEPRAKKQPTDAEGEPTTSAQDGPAGPRQLRPRRPARPPEPRPIMFSEFGPPTLTPGETGKVVSGSAEQRAGDAAAEPAKDDRPLVVDASTLSTGNGAESGSAKPAEPDSGAAVDPPPTAKKPTRRRARAAR
ncbi:MAG TPA: NYN domain-containing protein [Chloroflexota bacterium]|nr:NYN domain-containing protein [Chloroflexota bacterium]